MSNSYINTHPENSPVIIPFINNDIAFLLNKGGTATITYDGVQKSQDLNVLFNGQCNYFTVYNTDGNTVVITLKLHKTFTWTSHIYVDFGLSSWRAKTIKIEVMNSNYSDDNWTQKYSTTTNGAGNLKVSFMHTPSGARNSGAGFNRVRFTFDNWNGSDRRIAQLGLINYASAGVSETFISKGGTDTIFGTLAPNTTNSIDLGTSSKYWKNGYFTNINGVVVGNSPKFTDTNTTDLTQMTNVLPTTKGGSGTKYTDKTALTNGLINSLPAGSADPVDTDYYVSQYAGGGTTTTSYHRRPVSALWNYIKGKLQAAALTFSNIITFQKPINHLITGTGTAQQDKGSSASPRYFPVKWTFNTGRTPTDGDVIRIKIPVAGHSWGVYISIDNGTSYHPVILSGTTRVTTQYSVNTYLELIFEASGYATSMTPVTGANSVNDSTITGGAWRVLNYHDSDTNHLTSAWCETAAATAAKFANCTNYSMKNPSYLHILMKYPNTSQTALTLNVNGQGAKPIYINGSASSATNYTLPAGTYIIFYDGTNFYFRTDNKITANITGDAGTVNGHAVNKDVPSDAVFTDTTYSNKTAASGGTQVSLVTTGEKYTWNNKTSNTGTVTSITLKAGTGISLDTNNTAITTSGARTISHADTSSQDSVSNSNRTYIQSVTLDDYGHVTGLTSATETVVNTDQKVYQSQTTSSAWKKIAIGRQNAAIGAAVSPVTDQIFVNPALEFQASTGTLNSTIYRINNKANIKYNSTNDYVEVTKGIAAKNFYLENETIPLFSKGTFSDVSITLTGQLWSPVKGGTSSTGTVNIEYFKIGNIYFINELITFYSVSGNNGTIPSSVTISLPNNSSNFSLTGCIQEIPNSYSKIIKPTYANSAYTFNFNGNPPSQNHTLTFHLTGFYQSN